MKKLDHDTEGRDCMYDVYIRQVGNSLPDDEEDLLAGIMDGLEPITLPRQAEELDEYDVFGSGGGMELDSDPIEGITAGMTKASIADCYAGNGANQHNFPNGVGTVAGEHPYGEHPSRTLFVRNINSNVEDSELRDLFQVIMLNLCIALLPLCFRKHQLCPCIFELDIHAMPHFISVFILLVDCLLNNL